MEGGDISALLKTYGDFFLYKDTKTSVFMEFVYIDQEMVPS